jgi:hypothetical protein
MSLLFFIYTPPESRADNARKLAVMPGFTTGARYGLQPRAGIDLAIISLKCQDGCDAYGIVTGVGRLSPFEYYIGAGYGGAYFVTFWTESAITFVKDEITGARALLGASPVLFPILPYLAFGYDTRPKTMYVEAGVTGKIPIPLD